MDINTILAVYTTDLSAIAEAQSHVKLSCTNSNFKSYALGNGKSIICEIATPYPRPVIPDSLQKLITEHFHSLGHFGFLKTANISIRYYWQGVRNEIRILCRNCFDCQRSKVGRHTKSALETLALPSNRFETRYT